MLFFDYATNFNRSYQIQILFFVYAIKTVDILFCGFAYQLQFCYLKQKQTVHLIIYFYKQFNLINLFFKR